MQARDRGNLQQNEEQTITIETCWLNAKCSLQLIILVPVSVGGVAQKIKYNFLTFTFLHEFNKLDTLTFSIQKN